MKYSKLFFILFVILSACQAPINNPSLPRVVVPQVFHAAFSPDQKQVAYSLSEREKERVIVYDLQTQESKAIFTQPLPSQDRLAPIFWWRDSRSLLLKKSLNNEKEQFFVVNRLTNAAQEVYQGQAFISHNTLAETTLYFVDQGQKDTIKKMDLGTGAIDDYVKVPLDFYDRFDFELFSQDKQINILFRLFKGEKVGQQPQNFAIQQEQTAPQAAAPAVDYYHLSADKQTTALQSMKDLKEDFLFLGGGLSFDNKFIGYNRDQKSYIISREDDQSIAEVEGFKAKWIGNERFIVQTREQLLFYAIKDNQATRFKEIPLSQVPRLGDFIYLSQAKQLLLLTQDKIYSNDLEGGSETPVVLEKPNGALRLIPSNQTVLAIFNPAPISDPNFSGDLPLPVLYQWDASQKTFQEITKGATLE